MGGVDNSFGLFAGTTGPVPATTFPVPGDPLQVGVHTETPRDPQTGPGTPRPHRGPDRYTQTVTDGRRPDVPRVTLTDDYTSKGVPVNVIH